MDAHTPLPLLLADIGGTSTRLARAGYDGIPVHVRLEANDSHAALEHLLRSYLDRTDTEHPGLGHPGLERPRVAVLAVACPVEGEELRLVNRAWHFSAARLSVALGLERLEVVNDFVALAHGVPGLTAADLLILDGRHDAPSAGPMLVCGPGTGLGAALVLPRADGIEVLASEAGHMRFGAVGEDEARLLAHLEKDVGPVAVEHVLSGPGLERMHLALSGVPLSSRAIIAAAMSGGVGAHGLEARGTCHLFLRILGRVLGDLVLAFEARGGVYIGGGIGRALAPLMVDSPLRTAFEDHPPFADRMARVPIRAILHETPGLVGAGRIGRRLLTYPQV